MALAIFDLDDTLIHGDSASLWSREMVRLGWVEDEAFLSLDQELMNAYSQGKLAMEEYMAFSLAPMAGRTVEEVAEAVAHFIEAVIEPLVYQEARQAITRHKAAGDRLLVISATGLHIVSPVAAHLGIDEVLAIDLEVEDGRFTGLTEGILTYREGKVLRLSEWLRAQDEMLEGAFFYSDSRNDLPLLKLVDNPVTVNPDPTLRAYAQEHGWPVLEWS
ncbi:HAD family hydrolase [Pseudomonas sp. 20GA0080]|uniref:HAD family hydrolase n=1 Tax=Pseudomonas alliivorans TaxID=2810613 RepID=UPI001AEB2555|nr:HAD family hydrolase [Pseudomonas alliivorans]MBP0953608.1 HAD family hydrolase [Pseudomonas alliivorans]